MPTIDVKYQLQQGTGTRGEPVRKNTWEVEIPAILGAIPLFASEFVCPYDSVEKLEIRHFNGVTYIAGKATIEEGSLKIRDVIDPDTYMALKQWRNRVFNSETSEMGYASEYKQIGYAHRYDSKGVRARTFELHGLWPTKVMPGEFNYESFDGNIIELPLSCDWFRVT